MLIALRTDQPSYLNDFSQALLNGFYLLEGETLNDGLARAAEAYCYGDYDLAQRIYEAAHNGWFMFASPVLSNAPKGSWTDKPSKSEWKAATNGSFSISEKYFDGDIGPAMPISCFSMMVPDTIQGQKDAISELASLSVSGGGVGLHNAIRATSDKAPGPIPFAKVLDGAIGYFQQAKNRRGACALYMDVSHPDIIEHIRFRVPSGGDHTRKSDNRNQFNNAVNITDDFIAAVMNDDNWNLVCPHSGEVRETLRARDLWHEILDVRILTGEPYIFKIDTANRLMPETQKELGLRINGSNLCSEITLPTNEDRTFVCCLSSLNLEKFDEWRDTTLVADLTRFLDNVLQFFIENAGRGLEKAVYSATQERALGIGAMGWHYYLQSKGIAFETGGFNSSIQHSHIIFSEIKKDAVEESRKLAQERTEPSDMTGSGLRNSTLLAIAPTSNNSVIAGTSPAIEPISGNAYNHITRAGTFLVKNPYLEKVLKQYSYDQDAPSTWLDGTWKSIVENDGSVQHLSFLSDDERNLFKTAYEIDQHWVIEQADARGQYICQAQSLNLFFPAASSRGYYNSVHLKALNAEYVKSLYYVRTLSSVSTAVVKDIERNALVDWQGDECVACQG